MLYFFSFCLLFFSRMACFTVIWYQSGKKLVPRPTVMEISQLCLLINVNVNLKSEIWQSDLDECLLKWSNFHTEYAVMSDIYLKCQIINLEGTVANQACWYHSHCIIIIFLFLFVVCARAFVWKILKNWSIRVVVLIFRLILL